MTVKSRPTLAGALVAMAAVPLATTLAVPQEASAKPPRPTTATTTAPGATPSSTGTAPVPDYSVISGVPVTLLDCPTTPTPVRAETQNDASPPLCVNGTWVYDLPASTAPGTPRRTETHWGNADGTRRSFAEGDTVTYEAVYTGSLGQAAQGDGDWHVIWQLIGPVQGSWPGPLMGLNVRNGSIRVGGGGGTPGQDWATNNHEWSRDVGTWTDGRPVKIKVTTHLSSDPAKGWVSVWVDDVLKLDRWHPVGFGSAGKPTATWYAGQDYLVSRTGLYRGTQSGSVPTYRQVVAARVLQAG